MNAKMCYSLEIVIIIMIFNMKVTINTCVIRGKMHLGSMFLSLVDILVVSNSPVKLMGRN